MDMVGCWVVCGGFVFLPRFRGTSRLRQAAAIADKIFPRPSVPREESHVDINTYHSLCYVVNALDVVAGIRSDLCKADRLGIIHDGPYLLRLGRAIHHIVVMFSRCREKKNKMRLKGQQRQRVVNIRWPPRPSPQPRICIGFDGGLIAAFPRLGALPSNLRALFHHCTAQDRRPETHLPSAMACMTTLLLPDPSRLLNHEGPRDSLVLLIPP